MSDTRRTLCNARRGFTLVELLTAIVIMGMLVALGIPRLRDMVEKARVAKAIGDIRAIQTDLMAFEAGNQPLPASLAAIGRGGLLDPWGNPYVYNNFALSTKGKGIPAGARRDRFLVPLNTTFDLYSKGRDKATVAPISNGSGADDIVRANNGGYVGLGRKY